MTWESSSRSAQTPKKMTPERAIGSRSTSDTGSLLRAMTGQDAAAQLPIVTRTRRAIRIADQSRREQGEHGRRHVGIALLVFGVLFIALAPALWSSIDDIAAGEHFGDLPAQAALLYALLMVGIVAALAAVWHARMRQDEFRQE